MDYLRPSRNIEAADNAWDNDPEVKRLESRDKKAALAARAIANSQPASHYDLSKIFDDRVAPAKHRMDDSETIGRPFNLNPQGKHAKREQVK